MLTGEWVTGTFAAGIGGSYRHDGNAEKGKKSAAFELKIPAAKPAVVTVGNEDGWIRRRGRGATRSGEVR